MIASLPMYARAENAQAHDRFWDILRNALAGEGIDAPRCLTRSADPWNDWQAADLLFSQTCSLPFRARLNGRVRIVGTPDFDLPGCGPGDYHSVLVVHRDDPRQDLAEFMEENVAINDRLSQSGWAALCAHLRQSGLPPVSQGVITGSHRASAQAVAEGHAALASLDAVSWRLITQWDDFARVLRVLERTAPTPGLPYITSAQTDPAPLRRALCHAVDQLDEDLRTALGGLKGVAEIPEAAYLSLPLPPECPEFQH